MKKCPYCAEEIQDEAIKCKHCGSMFTESAAEERQMQPETPKQKEKDSMAPNPFAIGGIVIVVIVIFSVLTLFNSGKETSEPNNMSSVEAATEVEKTSPKQSFVDKKLNPFINSISTSMDTTWKQNVAGPVDNYVLGISDTETVNMNLKLAVDLLEPKIKEIEEFTVPIEYGLEDHINDAVNKLKEDLSDSFKARLKAAKHYEKAVKDGTIYNMSQEDHENLLIDSNTKLELATLQYKFIIENIK